MITSTRSTLAVLGLLMLAAAGCSTSSEEPRSDSTAAATPTSSPSVAADPSDVRCANGSARYRLAQVDARGAVAQIATRTVTGGGGADGQVLLGGGTDADVTTVGATIEGTSSPRVAAALQAQAERAAKVSIAPVGSTLADEPKQRTVTITNPDDAGRTYVPYRWTTLVTATVEESSCAATPSWSQVGDYTAYSPLVDGLTACGGIDAGDPADDLAQAARQQAGC
ncbi:hypothetical protein [Nocardioides sp.]|uniref:hypothetical protein n=1 Tax=Nocardioides sp. TaxID=35761 RepID=UPI0035170F6A